MYHCKFTKFSWLPYILIPAAPPQNTISGGPAMHTRSKLRKKKDRGRAMHTGATELVAEIMRSLDADTWTNAKWPLHLTIPLSQTCKEVRKAVHDARMCASVRVACVDSFFAARKYEIAQLRLDPLFGLSPFSGVGNSYGREALLVQELPRQLDRGPKASARRQMLCQCRWSELCNCRAGQYEPCDDRRG
jgi:hypothetical protein